MQKLLVVDDDYAVRYAIKEGFKSVKPDLSIIEADSGSAALLTVEEQNVDAVLLDIMMPGMDGIQVANLLHTGGKKIPIVFLSAKTDHITKSMCSAYASEFIEKPYELLDLIKRVEKVL